MRNGWIWAAALTLAACNTVAPVDGGGTADAAGASDAGGCMMLGDRFRIGGRPDVLSSSCAWSTYQIHVTPEGVGWGEETFPPAPFIGCAPAIAYAPLDGGAGCSILIEIDCVDGDRRLQLSTEVQGPVAFGTGLVWSGPASTVLYRDGEDLCTSNNDPTAVCWRGDPRSCH